MTNIWFGLDEGLARVTLNGTAKAELTLKAGPVVRISADPLAPNLVYAATVDDGLFRSDDGGATWEQAGPGIGSLVWSMAVSYGERVNGAGVIYIGTEPSALWRSEDRGATFHELPALALQDIPSRPEWSFPPAPDTHHIESIAIDPGDPQKLLVGIELGGIFRSGDGGENWELCPDADPDAHTLLTHPGAPGRVYESGGMFYAETRDGGATWRRDLEGIPEEICYFDGAAVDPGDPETIVIVAAKDPYSGHAVPIPGFPVWSTLYRRVGDEPWQELTDGLPDREGTAMGFLTTSPDEPGAFYYTTITGDLYRSGDSGATWSNAELQWPADLPSPVIRCAGTVFGSGGPIGSLFAPSFGDGLDPALRLALMNLACGPQAQRRYVQLGSLQRACSTVEAHAPRVGELVSAGLLDEQQAAQLEELGSEVAKLRAASDDFMAERDAGPRDFLFGHALEDEGWHNLRHHARTLFTSLRETGSRSPAEV
ncbi:hypothetical protein DSM104299_00780 [Baekduia alba]|uniref:WD40/YVTN/BNR-like repeat-containing protein n=1 Tax=Baekduia alba TaxID=2997333 RepID=UPI0023412AD8|nr:hypothetical protein [Baekduia alba]WCB92095.1 hypothetical protein DSM104299_00780 [Baekduia alba]